MEDSHQELLLLVPQIKSNVSEALELVPEVGLVCSSTCQHVVPNTKEPISQLVVGLLKNQGYMSYRKDLGLYELQEC